MSIGSSRWCLDWWPRFAGRPFLVLLDRAIAQTRRWISQVVVGCNFCPFAAREVKLDTIRYRVVPGRDPKEFLVAFVEECQHLDRESQVETTLLIFPEALDKFDD